TLFCIVFYVLCFYSFSKALLNINLGVAYATWCAGGIVATTIISALIFGQKINGIGVIATILIVAGCVLLNLFGTSGH
ncbi:MAG: DMT family transporter, partial [Lachnospiraceae bacterium]